ncbi:hypothetical protein [Streptomyces sp. NPDC059455]|uniref:hypothetical protein n=1 Tax=Streptomyces sp. NPDC059455 TaxID=3346837 RepID=UPI0036802BB7
MGRDLGLDGVVDHFTPSGGEVFGSIIAATVQINETCGMVPGSTASVKWPQQSRMPLGRDGVLGVAEYVIVADAGLSVDTAEKNSLSSVLNGC